MFLHAIMLAGVGGAAVPLVLHLLTRSRARTVEWGAMMFLDGGGAARPLRAARLRQYLLLALRMLLVALLAVAFARPLSRALPAPRGPVAAVVIVDRSASTAVADDGRPRADAVRDLAAQILRSRLRRGDRAAILQTGAAEVPGPPPRLSTDPPALVASLAAAADDAEPAPTSVVAADVADALTRAADLLDRDAPAPAAREVFLVCDRQASSWRNVTDAFAAAWSARARASGAPPALYVLPVGSDLADNVAVDAIDLPDAPVAGQTVDVAVRVRNYGPSPRTAVPLSLSLDDRPVRQTLLSVDAGGVAVAHVPVRFAAARSHLLRAKIGGDAFAADDELARAVEVLDPPAVLLIDGDAAPPPPPSAGAPLSGATAPPAGAATPGRAARPPVSSADFLSVALAPLAAAGRAGPDAAEPAVVPLAAADFAALDRPDRRPVVVLCDVPELTPSQALALERHVYAGGGLMVVAGPLVRPENYNRLLYREGGGLLPAALAPATPDDDPAATAFGAADATHPVFSFLAQLPGPPPAPAVRRYFPVGALAPAARVLARTSSGAPLVLENDVGRGRVLLVTTPADRRWNDWPASPAFLPFAQSAARYLAAADVPPRDLAPRQPLIARFAAAAVDRARLTIPDRSVRDVPVARAGRRAEVRSLLTFEPGVYALSLTGRGAPERTLLFTVRPPRDESDLTPLSPGRWAALSAALGFRRIEPGDGPVAAALGPPPAPRELWPILLAAAAALAVAEVALARAWSPREPPAPADSPRRAGASDT